MRTITLYRSGRTFKALEVIVAEIVELMSKHECVSISQADKEWLKTLNLDEYAGVVMGDVDLIGTDKENAADCWFVNRDFIVKNYKNLETDKFSFGDAIELLKQGYKVARVGWNGKGMYLVYIDTKKLLPYLRVDDNLKELFSDSIKYVSKDDWRDTGHLELDNFITMRTAQKTIQFGWLASQADLLAEDWVVVKEKYKN